MFNSIVEAVFHHAAVTPEKLCLVDDNGQVTYREYADQISRLAGFFRKEGVQKGDRVVIEACQTIEYLAIELALQAFGAVFVPVEHNCAAAKIQSFAERAQAKAVITCKEGSFTTDLCYTFPQIAEGAAAAESYIPEAFPVGSDISEILFSTGTTGREKGIVVLHSNNVALAENVMYGVEMEKDNVEMIPSPMNHSHGLRRYYANMYNGCTVVLLGSVMNARRFFYNMDNFGVNSMDLVPTALSVLLRLTKDKLAEYADRLRYIQFGAAPMMEADQKKICQLLPNTRLYNFYGSTESGCICIYDFNRPDDKKSCIGKPTHNAHIVIVDDDRNPIESSATNTGLLCCRGGQNMLEYWQDEEETRKVLIDGVVYSNDIAYFDEDGDIILMGRKGDVINVGGMKVTPTDVESAALTYEGMVDCICIPVDDAMSGKALKLLVVMEKPDTFNPKDLRTYLLTRLETYKVPMQYELVDKVARTYNGKLDRKFYTKAPAKV